MCDQDHFEDDRQQYEARRSSDAKAIRHHVGSGHRHDAAASRERGYRDRIGRERQDAGRHRRLLLRASSDRHGSGSSDVAGHLRAAAGVSSDGQTARRIGLFGARGESVLPPEESPDRREGRRNADRGR